MDKTRRKTARHLAPAPKHHDTLSAQAPVGPSTGLLRHLISARNAAPAALFLLLAVLAWRNITDLDFGIHMASGRWIVEHGRVPDTDPFTYTVPDHPYVAYHWLFQVILYELYDRAGVLAVVLMRWVMLVATFALLADALRVRGCSSVVGAVVGLLAVLAAEWRFALRPELLSFLLIAATIWVFERRRAEVRSPLWLLPLIQLLWVNTHIYVLGWIVIAAYVGEELWRRRKLDRTLLLTLGISAAVIFLNPYGLTAVMYPLKLLTRMNADNLFAREITEFASPFNRRHSPLFPWSITLRLLCYKVLLAAAVVALFAHLRRMRVADVTLIVAFGALSVAAIRNLPLFLVACVISIATGLSSFRAGPMRSHRPKQTPVVDSSVRPIAVVEDGLLWAVAGCALVMAFRAANGSFYATDRRPDKPVAELSRTELALDGADWLAAHHLEGFGFNNLNIGGTLMWRNPSHRHFIDGRNEVTGEDFFTRYRQIAYPGGWNAGARAYGFQYVMLNHANTMPLVKHLAADSAWRLVFADQASTIFVRADGPNGGQAPVRFPDPVAPDERWQALRSVHPDARFRGRLARWLWMPEPLPEDSFRYGSFLLMLGQVAAAERPLLAAARASPSFYETSLNLGAVYYRQRQWEAAALCYRNVLMLRPEHRTARDRLAVSERALESEAGAGRGQGDMGSASDSLNSTRLPH